MVRYSSATFTGYLRQVLHRPDRESGQHAASLEHPQPQGIQGNVAHQGDRQYAQGGAPQAVLAAVEPQAVVHPGQGRR